MDSKCPIELERSLRLIKSDCSVYLGGGRGPHPSDSYSDTDLIIYCDQFPSMPVRKRAISLGHDGKIKERNDSTLFGEHKVDFTYIDQRKLSGIIDEKGKSYLTYVIYPKVITTPNSTIEREQGNYNVHDFLLNKNEQRKKIAQLRDDIDKIHIARSRGDSVYLLYLLTHFSERMMEVVYSANDIPYIYPKKGKKMLQGMDAPESFLCDLELIALGSNDDEGVASKSKLLKRMLSNLEFFVEQHG
jgi:predicted nucleotidyltransferase